MPVAARARRPRAPPFIDPPGYARHRPETTLSRQMNCKDATYHSFRTEIDRAIAGTPFTLDMLAAIAAR